MLKLKSAIPRIISLSVMFLISSIIIITFINKKTELLKKQPLAKDGVLDLRNWDMEKQGMVKLDGQWEFYYNQLLTPEDFKIKNKAVKTGNINIPGSFYDYINENSTGQGCATYRLRVLTNSKQNLQAIKTEFIQTSHKVWVNYKVIIECGKVGKYKHESDPKLTTQIGAFYNDTGELDIVLQHSNYDYGIPQIDSIFLGTEAQISEYRAEKVGFDLFLFGGTLIAGIYHFALFLRRRKDKAPLYFSIVCALVGLRTMLVGERLAYSIFPSMSYILDVKLLLWTFFLYIPVLVLFIHSFYPDIISKRVVRVSNIIGIVYFLIILILPPLYYSNLVLPLELVSAFLLIYILSKMIYRYVTKNHNYELTIIAVFILFITRLNDILYEYSIIQTGSYAALGMIIFIAAQSYVLAARFSIAFSSIEEINDKLKSVDKLKDDFLENKKKLSEVLEYDRLKTEFIANISHELRTPLNVIWSTIQLLQSLDTNAMEKNYNINKYLSSMNQNTLRLLRLINNLIDTTKIDGGYLSLDLLNDNIVNIVEEITLSAVNYAEAQGINLIFDTDVEEKYMAFDADKMERIILNILSNAVKFTEEGGSIFVNIYDLQDKIRICIRDTGIGIPQNKLESIFERFSQVDRSISRRSEGSGIGLSLVKSLVEMHGGTIQAKSKLGEGSEFIIELPVKLVEKNADIELKASNQNEVSKYIERTNIEFSDIYH